MGLGLRLNFASTHRDTITYYAKIGENDWSEPVFADPVTLRARVEKKQRMVRSPGGNALPSDTLVEVGPYPEIHAGDRIDVGYGDEARDVMTVDMVKDFWGRILGWRVYL